jgi:hypothetical protein
MICSGFTNKQGGPTRRIEEEVAYWLAWEAVPTLSLDEKVESLQVDRLPALFAHAVEYPKPLGIAALEPAYARSAGEGCRVRETGLL